MPNSTSYHKDLPLVSIITVTRNAEEFIERCIKSVLNQSYPNIEHIILDGKSTDGTVEVLKRYDEKIAFWKSEPDNGIYNAMNKAVQHSKGDWIIFIGADDVLFEGFSQMAFLLKDKKTIYYGESKWREFINGGEFNLNRLTKENLCHQAIFYPRSIFEKYTYDEKYVARADYVLNMQCWNDKSYKKQFYPILISDYAPGGFSAHNPDILFHQTKAALIKEHFSPYYYLKYKYRCYKNVRKNRPADMDLTW
ncbi:glycosyltransferase family 2 protein [Arcticibacter tournemirensis]